MPLAAWLRPLGDAPLGWADEEEEDEAAAGGRPALGVVNGILLGIEEGGAVLLNR